MGLEMSTCDKLPHAKVTSFVMYISRQAYHTGQRMSTPRTDECLNACILAHQDLVHRSKLARTGAGKVLRNLRQTNG